MTEPFICHPRLAEPVQTSAQDEATIARIEEQRLEEAADPQPIRVAPHIRALLLNGEVRLASDRIARLLDDPEKRHLVQQHIIDMKAAVEALETTVFRMAIDRHNRQLDLLMERKPCR